MKEKPVLIIWEDAGSGDAGWRTLEDIQKKEKLALVHTLGFLVIENKKQITVVQSIVQEKKGDLNTPFSIPAGWIKKMKDLDV